MPGFPLTVASGLACFHKASAVLPTTQKAVAVLGQPVVTAPAKIGVALCPFATAAGNQPCLKIEWQNVSAKVTVQGQPLLLMPPPGTGPAPGVCFGPVPQGIPEMRAMQTKVAAA